MYKVGDEINVNEIDQCHKSYSSWFFLIISDNLEFYISANNVILSSGNRDGVVEPKYFKQVMHRDRKSGGLHSEKQIRRKVPLYTG